MKESRFEWLASFDSRCPFCGKMMPANVKHICNPEPLAGTVNNPSPDGQETDKD